MSYEENLNVNNTINSRCHTIHHKISKQIIDMSLDKAAKSREVCDSNWYADDHLHLDTVERQLLNDWLANFNFPMLDYAVLFQKKCLPKLRNSNIHIDYNDEFEVLSKAVVNFPILNCIDTKMTWWSGEYTWTKKYASKKAETSIEKNHNCFIPFAQLHWHSEPELVETYNVTNEAFIAKVDTPHSVTAGDEFRIVLSLRLQGNPDFETLKKIYLKSTYDF